MELRFTGEIWYWRGPAPFHFVTVPESEAAEIKAVSAAVTYGWGMIPAAVRIGKTTVTTALWSKDGGYIVPIKKAMQIAEELELGDDVEILLTIDV